VAASPAAPEEGGAVIVVDIAIIATGYNGTPIGVRNCDEGGCPRCASDAPVGSGYDACICVHAEQNAIVFAARHGNATQGGVLYTTLRPCFGCAKELLQAHVKQIVYLHDWTPSDVDPEMDSQKKAEYQKLTARFDTKQLCIADPRAEWAVSALRKKS
jgi:dCMP deaminase